MNVTMKTHTLIQRMIALVTSKRQGPNSPKPSRQNHYFLWSRTQSLAYPNPAASRMFYKGSQERA